jgi:hypothetical protein
MFQNAFRDKELRRLNTFYYRDLYRVMHDSLRHFTKSIYFKGGKYFDMRPTFRNRNSPKYIWTRSGRWISSVAAATSTSTTAEDQALLRWARRSRDLKPCYFFLWGHSKDFVSLRLYHRIYMRPEDELSLPSQKSIVTCCNGCGRKGKSTWCLPCYKVWTYRARVRYVKKPGDIPIYVQQNASLHSLFYLETALHASGGSITHHQECKQLYL